MGPREKLALLIPWAVEVGACSVCGQMAHESRGSALVFFWLVMGEKSWPLLGLLQCR